MVDIDLTKDSVSFMCPQYGADGCTTSLSVHESVADQVRGVYKCRQHGVYLVEPIGHITEPAREDDSG